jgi:hypothetical protein
VSLATAVEHWMRAATCSAGPAWPTSSGWGRGRQTSPQACHCDGEQGPLEHVRHRGTAVTGLEVVQAAAIVRR